MPCVNEYGRPRGVGARAALAVLVAAGCGEVPLSPVGGHPDPSGAAGAGGASSEPLPGAGDSGAGGAPSAQPLPGDHVFGDAEVLEIHVSLDPADLTYLEEHGNEEVYVPAQATISGSRIGEVSFVQLGVRHKGAWTLHHCWEDGVRTYAGSCSKLSYKLKFDEYLPDERLDGLKRLNLHAALGDPTRLHELLAYSTFREFGVDAPRTAVAKVFVNGAAEGLFIVVEAIDGRYTKAHFPQGGGDGNLYKEIWPSPELDLEDLAASLRTNEDVGDVSGFVEFTDAVAAATPATFAADMASWVDVDHTLRYIAVDRAIKNWDGIMAFYSPRKPHNFYWYHDAEGSGQFRLVPWDLDNTFWDFDPYMDPQLWVSAESVPDWNEEPAHCEARSIWDMSGSQTITPPRCDRFLDLLAETQFERFQTFSQELLSGPFELTRLREKLRSYSALIEPIIESDPYANVYEWRNERLQLDRRLSRMVQDFEAFVAAGLTSESAAAALDPAVSDVGLDATRQNGFEFLDGTPDVAPMGTYAYGSDGTTFAILWNASSPVAGSHDLRLEFQFSRQPGAWNEWVNFGYSTPIAEEVDLRQHATLVLSMRADRTRTVRVRLASPAYDDTFGGIWTELGMDVTVSTTPTSFQLPLGSFAYPDWAKAAWELGQGWATSDAEAYAILRERVSGLIFAPSPTHDPAGELTAETEAGYLQVDDIEFRQ